MKRKLMAMILAAGLAAAGTAETAAAETTAMAQAAGTATVSTCRHQTLNREETFLRASYYDPANHLSTYLISYRCSECGIVKLTQTEEMFEQHDYEQIYYQDGSVMSTCLGCHDSYYW